MRRAGLAMACLLLAVLAARADAEDCVAAEAARIPASIGRLVLLGTAEVARPASGDAAQFGGISGLDYDPATRRWYLLSDDRGERAAPRFYPAEIGIGPDGIRGIHVQAAIRFPIPAGEVPDPESLRILQCRNVVAWSSEGDRRLGLQPSVRLMTLQGQALGELALPANLRLHPDVESGPRHNLSFEGLASFPGSDRLWVSMEAPLYEDGPVASLKSGALLRFTRLSLRGGPAQQFAYPLEPIATPGTGGKKRADNGVSEILSLSDDRLLVIERSGHEVSDGLYEFDVRLYEAERGDATDVVGLATLAGSPLAPMKKRLLLDLSTLGLAHLDNIEGAAWGPRLADGRATLMLAADDNFASNQRNQFLLFAVIPP